MASKLVRQTMKVIGRQHQVFLLCDSWYHQSEVAGLVNQLENLELICNARGDTVLYDLPSVPTGKRDRPQKYGDKLLLDLYLSRD